MRCSFIYVLSFCLLFLCLTSSAQKKKILILHSYHQGLNWTDNISEGMQSVFKNYEGLELQFEYMDSKRNIDPAYLEEFAKLYELKHHNIPFEVIIASDNNALEFTRKYRNKFFKGIPVVFASIDQFDESLIEGMDKVTGVTEYIDFKRTIQEALRLHPKAKNLVVINDNITTSAIINRNHIKSFWPEIGSDVNLVFLESLSISDLLTSVRSLDDSNIILLINFSKDSNGDYISYQENIEMIRGATNLPIYSAWKFYLDEGIVGGMLTSGFKQGELAAGLAMQIVNGEDINNIPIVTSGYNSLMFDYNQMKRLGIARKDLPEGSIIINVPATFYQKYKVYILIVLVFILFILIVLYAAVRKRKIAEKRIKDREKMILNTVINTEEEERKRFAKDLHDSIAPFLASINLYLSALAKSDDREKNKKIIDRSRTVLDEAVISLKEISNNLSPHLLNDFGLEKAINSFINNLKFAEGINITFNAENLEERFTEQIEVVLYRVVIELIHNTLKHAKASSIEINLSREEDKIRLIYIDDGVGFDFNKKLSESSGMGLYSILSRLRSLNGKYKIRSSAERGGMMAVIYISL